MDPYISPLSILTLFIFSHLHFHTGQATSALTFELPDNENICFFETFTGSQKYFFQYNVLKGGRNDVDASIESPNGKIIYKETKRKKEKFLFETSVGDYKFCFSNEFSTFTHKVVHFHVRPAEEGTLAVRSGNKKPTVPTQSEASLDQVYQLSKRVMVYQTDYRLREAKTRYKADQLNHTVQWWSIGQALVIVVTGFGQVFILKTFFTDRRQSTKGLSEETTKLAPWGLPAW